jgi:hypothetical protein
MEKDLSKDKSIPNGFKETTTAECKEKISLSDFDLLNTIGTGRILPNNNRLVWKG